MAVRAQLGGHEGLHRVAADGLGRGHAEQTGGPAAPLLDQTVGADRERGDPDVVIDRAGRAALPHDIARGPDDITDITRRPRYFAHATVPSSSHTGPVLPAVFSTTAPTDTAFTITARSQSLSARFCPTSGDRCASLHSPNQGEPARTTPSCHSFRDGSPNDVRNRPRAGVPGRLRRRVPHCVRWVDPEADRRLPPAVPGRREGVGERKIPVRVRLDQAYADGPGGVPEGVGHQLADEQNRQVAHRGVEAPGTQRTTDGVPGVPYGTGFGREGPLGAVAFGIDHADHFPGTTTGAPLM